MEIEKMKFRSSIEVKADILKSVAVKIKPITPFGISWRIGTNYKDIKEYLQQLIGAGLLEYDKLVNNVEVTSKGYHFLDLYQQIEELMGNRFLVSNVS